MIITTGLEFARRDLVLSDIEEQEGLDGIDLENAEPFELILDHVEQQPVQAFHQRQVFQVAGKERFLRAIEKGLVKSGRKKVLRISR